MLSSQFEQSFETLYHFLTDKSTIDERVREMVGELYRNQPLTRLMYSPGHTPNPQAQSWYELINSHLASASCNPEEQDVSNVLAQDMVFDAWSFQAEKVFHGLTSFAKSLPGFSDLLLDDRIILLKEGRADALNILK